MEEFFDVLDENGNFINKTASRDICHKEGLWHRAVVVFVINSKGEILLQQRSANKKLWPNLWDITAGGHLLAGEVGYEAAIRETKEELDLNINISDLLFIGASKSTNIKGDIINNHFNEYFIVNKDVNIDDLVLQEDEVQAIKWFNPNELIIKIHNNYEGLTDKIGCWEYLERYLNHVNNK